MSDIVEKLRNLRAPCDPTCRSRCDACPEIVSDEAADEIERLRAALQSVTEAMMPGAARRIAREALKGNPHA